MFRAIFTFISFFSLLVCIASLVMWPLSRDYITGAGFNITPENSVGFETHRGWIVFDVAEASDRRWFGYHDDASLDGRIVLIDWIEDSTQLGVPTASLFNIKMFAIPLWVLALITALPPGLWIWLFIGRSRRRRKARPMCALRLRPARQCRFDSMSGMWHDS